MNYLKKLGKIFLINLLIILISTFVIAFFSYFNIIGGTFLKILKIMVPIISLFVSGILLGKVSDKKGWLEGLKFSLVYVLLIFLFNYLGLDNKLEARDFIFYATLIAITIFGSALGINRKRDNKKTF